MGEKDSKEYQQAFYKEHAEEIKKQRQEHYQKKAEEIKKKRRARYAQQKKRSERKRKERQQQVYNASSIKILMSLKTYTELNAEKKRLWAEFCWTLKDANEGINDISGVMKLRESADNLVRDYWTTAKGAAEEGKHWAALSEEQQERLISYWGREKAREEWEIKEGLKKMEKRGEELEKEIEMAKFHEERGKVKCDCWQCQASQEIREEVKKEQQQWELVNCAGCDKRIRVNRINEEGLCKKCEGSF